MAAWDKIKRLFSRKWFKLTALLVLGLLLILGAFHMCTGKRLLLAKTYHIGRNNSWPPLDLMGKEPYVTAFTTDLVTEIANRQNLKIIFYSTDNTNLFGELDAGSYDAVLMDIIPNSFMREHYNLSDPLMLTGPVLAVPLASKITSLEQLGGQGGVGVHKGSQNFFKLSQNINLTLVTYDNIINALDDLVNGTLVGVVLENAIAHIYIDGIFKDKLKISTPPLTDEGIRLVTHWNTDGEHLIDEFNKGLKEIRADGTFAKLVNKWTLHAQ